ncbi:uncharacterized protein DNG_06244 [Cephalotrichum gorgonifer]|uniref:mRNA stability protein n=1 Tax=Cephalotrichum gorgonifer TaxID=2041049 RepID=A0AAE8MZA1_9PEZI|nr:uncharacterized protein DNG_06244 [Cephalotrichum gorgonifer]
MEPEEKAAAERSQRLDDRAARAREIYGIPPHLNLLHHQLDQRKYFDSGDFALSKARRPSDIGPITTGIEHTLKDEYKDAWERLSGKNEPFMVDLFVENNGDEAAGKWDCRLVDYPDKMSELHYHPIHSWEVVLYARRPSPLSDRGHDYVVKTFGSRSEANARRRGGDDHYNRSALAFDVNMKDCERKVNAACDLLPGAKPTHYITWANGELANGLHRAIWRGSGFWSLWRGDRGGNAAKEVVEATAPTSMKELQTIYPGSLPIVDLVGDKDPRYLDILFEDITNIDRFRLVQYLRKRPAGIGVSWFWEDDHCLGGSSGDA